MLTDSKVLQLRLPNFEESLDGVFKIQLGLKRLLWITCMVFLLGLLSFSSALDAAGVEVFDLRCERLDAPLGMDMKSPRLSWKIGSNERDVSQLAYRILVASDPKQLQRDSGDLWDSGKVESGQSVMIPYAGSTLSSLQRCYWKAKVWTANGVSEWSITSQWTMGLLYQNEWEGRWIGFDRAFPWDEVSKFSRLSARYFRQEIELNQQKHVSRATVFLMGLGLYELHLNGKKVGHQVLAPSPTDYTRNIKYNSLDVTELLNSGENALGIILGNGRFFTMRQEYKPYKIKQFGFPKLLLNLVVEYRDGSREVFATDNSWKGTADGPIRSNNEYDGEVYDARKEMPGWDEVDFDESAWLDAEYVQEPGGAYESQLNANMEVMDSIQPISLRALEGEGKGDAPRYLLDMGQNIAGWLRLRVNGKRGDCVTLRFAESIDEEGELLTAALRDAQATDYYTLKGGGVEHWEPKFVYHGFRYVEITGFPGTPTLDDFEGCVVYDRMSERGSIQTSNSLVNQILENAWWSIVSNYKGMPIDCPQRNERMPWLGDRAMGCFGESYLLDNYQLYRKWLDDIRNTQKADGCIADVAPAYFRYYSDNTSWPGTYLFVAEMLRKQYGDEGVIREHYAAMRQWMLYMGERYWKDGILIQDRYGDWCAPPRTIKDGLGKSADVKRPNPLISTAYFYRCLELMQRFARLSGQSADSETWEQMAVETKTAFHRQFYSAEMHGYGGNTQTENLLALALSLVPEAEISGVVESLRESIEVDHDGHLSVGLIGAQWLMRTLSDHGLTEVAQRLLTTTTYPSWGYMVEQGATTIWELWNATTAAPNMNSQNHVMMLGDLIPWMFESVAGIAQPPASIGFETVEMKPCFSSDFEFVKARLQSDHGAIESEWKLCDDGAIGWQVKIPCNSSAELHFPVSAAAIQEQDGPLLYIQGVRAIENQNGDTQVTLGSGIYQFTFDLQTNHENE